LRVRPQALIGHHARESSPLKHSDSPERRNTPSAAAFAWGLQARLAVVSLAPLAAVAGRAGQPTPSTSRPANATPLAPARRWYRARSRRRGGGSRPTTTRHRAWLPRGGRSSPRAMMRRSERRPTSDEQNLLESDYTQYTEGQTRTTARAWSRTSAVRRTAQTSIAQCASVSRAQGETRFTVIAPSREHRKGEPEAGRELRDRGRLRWGRDRRSRDRRRPLMVVATVAEAPASHDSTTRQPTHMSSE